MTLLGTVARIESGSGFPTSEQGHKDQEIPFLKVSDMNRRGNERVITCWNNSISRETQSRIGARVFPADTVIFPKIGAAIATNKKRLLRRPSCIDNNCMGVTPDASQMLPEYLLYLFSSKDLSDFASDSNPPSIRKSEVEGWDVHVPPLDEQRRTVDILSRAENIVRMRREAESKAKAIVPALFHQMFGLNGCTTVRLTELADVVSGVAKGRKLTGKRSRLVPYLRVANVQAGELDLSEIKTIEATEAEISELIVRAGDVLLTEGGDFDKVGRGALLEKDIGECIHQNHVFRVRTSSARLLPEYFSTFLQTVAAREYFLRAAKKTSNLASINMTQLKNLPVPVPLLERQEEFRQYFRSARKLEARQTAARQLGEESFHALLAQVFDACGDGRARSESEK
jgi:type I restriction enzyme S subunit